MITLDVKPYCHNCDEFYPVSETSKAYSINGDVFRSTVVRCENARKCEAIYKHILKENSKNDK